MKEQKIYKKPRCHNCEYFIEHTQSEPIKIKGVFLQFGCRYCTAGKKVRKFKAKDPKVYVPDWCSRKKEPAELRIYCFKDARTACLNLLAKAEGIKMVPYEFQYAVRLEAHTKISASEFYRRVSQEDPSKVLGVHLSVNEVIEIDDGLKPYYFFMDSLYEVKSIYFNGKWARKNVLEDHRELSDKEP